jgi:cytochrome c oxidase cbb3-type subunit I/II
MLQAKEIAASLKKDGIEVPPNKEIIAMIAYLQRLGTDINKK